MQDILLPLIGPIVDVHAPDVAACIGNEKGFSTQRSGMARISGLLVPENTGSAPMKHWNMMILMHISAVLP